MKNLVRALALTLLVGSATGLEAAENTAKAAERDIDTRIEVARERLEAAVRELTDLSMQLGERFTDRLALSGVREPRAIIGVQVDPAGARGGAKVLEVSPGGPAARAGIKPGDVIVALNDADLASSPRPAAALVEAMNEVAPGAEVQLRVRRGDDVVTRRLNTRAAASHPPLPLLAAPGGRVFDFEFFGAGTDAMAGLELATLNKDLGEYFGANEGVLVLRAGEDSPLKLRSGDIITAIDGRKPESASHATRILRSYQRGERVRLEVLRKRKSVTLEVAMPGRNGEDEPT
ncbi:MAG: PDZ domain-containing protein [Steroidobacteraceae bacterium]